MAVDAVRTEVAVDQGQEIIQRQGELEKIRQPYEDLQEKACEMVNYRREVWRREEKRGQKRGKLAYDGTPASARKIWSDGMQGYLVSRAIKWFMLKMANYAIQVMPEVKGWLQECEKVLYHAFHRSNFYDQLTPYFDDAGSSGTASIYGEEDVYNKKTCFESVHPKEIWIAENRYGRIDTVHRRFRITARQAAQKFAGDLDKLSDALKNNIRQHRGLGTEYEFIHAVYPNSDQHLGRTYRGSDGYTSFYVQTQNKKVIRRRQWDWMRYAVWRTRKYSGDVYGYSPAMEAMVEMEKLNEMAKTNLVAGQRAVNPVSMIPGELKGRVSLKPGARIYFDDPSQEVKYVDHKINYPVADAERERAIKVIERHYHVDLFLLLQQIQEQGQRTAYEVSKLISEQAILLGPEIGRLAEDALDPIIDLVFDIEYRAGNIPEPPAILLESGQTDLEVDYIGPLSQAQKRLFENMNIEESLIAVKPMVDLFGPSVKDWMDEDIATQQVLESSGWPQKAIRDRVAVDRIRKARAEQMQREEMKETLAGAADAVPKLQQPTQPGSPLEQMGEVLRSEGV